MRKWKVTLSDSEGVGTGTKEIEAGICTVEEGSLAFYNIDYSCGRRKIATVAPGRWIMAERIIKVTENE